MLASQASSCALLTKQPNTKKARHQRREASASEVLEDNTYGICCLPESLINWPPTLRFHLFVVLGPLFREASTVCSARLHPLLSLCLFVDHLKEGEEHILKLFTIFFTSYRHSYYLLFFKHLQSLFFLQNKRPKFTPITVFPFYFPNKFKRVE